jgi:LysM repeat protein
MTDDVFADDSTAQPSDQDTQVAQPQHEQSSDPFAEHLSAITKEDGTPKYTDVAHALESIPHAQAHISTLEADNAKLKEDLAEAKAAKELLAKQKSEQQPAPTGLTAEEVAKIAASTMTQAEEAKVKDANVNAVRSAFSTQYGEKAKDEMQRIAAENGMTVAGVKALAETSPNAVLKLAGIAPQSQTPAVKTPPGSVDNFTPQKPAPAPGSIMGGSNTADLVANWKAAGEAIKT